MRIAAELLEYGVLPSEIAEIALETITQGYIQALKVALSKLEVVENGKIAWTVLSLNDLTDQIHSDETEGIVNYCRNIDGVEVGAFFKETKEGSFKVSLRSKKYINVGTIAQSFGGGGHARAAGYTYYGSLEEAKSLLFHKLKEKKYGRITLSNNLTFEGVLPIFKPKGMTSHDVVAKLRRILKIKRIGHTGTLDPEVTGVLPICIGKATRIAEHIMELPKEYHGQLTLGVSTTTEDAYGEVIEETIIKDVTKDQIQETFQVFTGEIEQIPQCILLLK